MDYEKIGFREGQLLRASELNHIEEGISKLSKEISSGVSAQDQYTWGDLRGVDLSDKSSQTTHLKLKKPAYVDIADVKTINDNYDAIDSKAKVLDEEMVVLNERMDSLITNYPDGEDITLENEVKDARVRYNGITYGSAGSALRAIDQELSQLKQDLSSFVGSSIPDGLYYKDNQLYLTSNNVIISDPVTIVGGSGGGTNSSYVVNLTNLLESRIISVPLGTPVILKFNYTSVDNGGFDDGPGVGSLFINNIQQTNFTVPQGIYDLDITKYLKTGGNNVKVQITNSEGSYRSLSYTVNILSLSVTTTSSLMGTYNADSIPFQYTVNGSGTKTVHFIIDGKEIKTETITSSGQSRQFLVARQEDGPHIFEIYASVDSEGGQVNSNRIRAGMIWYSDSTVDPIILINSDLTEITQGESISIPFMVFHPSYETVEITQSIIDEDGEEYSSTNPRVGRAATTWDVHNYPLGQITFRISCERTTEEIQIKINKSTFNREIYQDNLLLEFNAQDRQNIETNPEHWAYGDIEASFTNIGWGSIDGWLTDAEGQGILRLLPKSSMYIPFLPFSYNIINTGYTIEVEIGTHNVRDYESIIAQSYNNGRGFLIKSQSASLGAEQTSISAQFKEDTRIRLTFVVEQNTVNSEGISTSSRLVYIYINGILCGIQQYAENDNFAQTNPIGITVGAETCGIDVYFIRFYNTAFTAEMQLNNYIVDRPTLAARIAADIRNDILDPDASDIHKKITVESIKGGNKYIIMKCPELPQFKGDKKKNMVVEYVDPVHPEKSFDAEGCQFDVQGTSSAGYPVKNFKISFKGGITYKSSGAHAAGFEFTENSLPSATLCLKADYASSEHANNVCLVDFYNTITPYKMPPQLVDERVRQGIYGQPILLFWLNTETNELSFEGMYNMNDDKSNENVFGFIDIDLSEQIANPRIECWEWKNNNTPFCLFQDDNGWNDIVLDPEDNEYKPNWQISFEPRFPDTDPMYDKTDALYRMLSWVVSTQTSRATGATLSASKYYLTRDTSWNKNKTYYSDENGTIKEIQERGDILSYHSDVYVERNIFYEKMGATSFEELVGVYTFSQDEETKLWSLYKGEDLENIDESISDIGSYGVTISNTSVTSFSFEYRITGEGWTTTLYEYFDKDTVEYRLSKFRSEFTDYFELSAMSFYYVFTEVFLMIDSRAKNMFLTTFDGTHWFPIPYDMDTALGINNEGQLVFDYNLEDTDYVDGSPVFNAQDSVLWNNFRVCFNKEIIDRYRQLRSLDGEREFSFDAISTKMNTYQEAWAEIIWNLDQEIKYLQPFFAGSNNLAMAQGNKQTQRDFWAFNAFKYRDSKYQAGDAMTNNIHLRIYNKGEITVTPFSHIYARVKFGNAKDETKRVLRNEDVKFNTDGIAAVTDLETLIYSADRISSLGDLSSLQIGYCDFSHATKLQSIIVGNEDENYRNGNLKTFTLGKSTLLQEVDVSNCYNLGLAGAGNTQTINASQCPSLEVFKAHGTKILGATFSNGGRLRVVKLPGTITNLTLRNQTQIESLDVEGYNNLSTLWLENVPNLPIEDIILNSPKLERVRLYNVEWTATNEEYLTAVFNKLKTCKGLNSTGVDQADAAIYARVHVESISEELLEEINSVFPNLIIVVDGVGKYYIKYVNQDRTELYHYIADEGTDAIDPYLQGYINEPSYSKEEDIIYYYNGWYLLPENIHQSYVIPVDYLRDFRVRFFNSSGEIVSEQWVPEGGAAFDPVEEGLMEAPTQAPSAQYSYIYKDWGIKLSCITQPWDLHPTYHEFINSYIVKIYGGVKQIGSDQCIDYGSEVALPSTDEVFNYYYDETTGEYGYYPIYSHIGWDTNSDGIDDGEKIIIAPEAYTEDPIIIRALFSADLTTDDSWEEIISATKDGTYVEKYPVGTQKEVSFLFDNVRYNGVVEIVQHNYDILADNPEETASLTFILKDIFIKRSIRNDPGYVWNDVTGSYAGGWSNTPFYNKIANITFDNEVLNDSIKKVLKKTDFGPSADNENLYHSTAVLPVKIFTPSATELGVLPAYLADNEDAKQGADGSKSAYIWYADNATRAKTYNDVPEYYWTRTYAASNQLRVLGVGTEGEPAFTYELTGLRCFEPAGIIFGFCL